jgi:uncharacterized protein
MRNKVFLILLSLLFILVFLASCSPKISETPATSDDINQIEQTIKTSIKYPEPTGFVSDFAEIFTEEEITQMEDFIKDFEENTTVEIAVVTVKSLEGLSMGKYAFELFNTWGIGKAGKNNGILLLVVLDEKLLRIEVGLGLEKVITNKTAENIVNEVIFPYMSENNIGRGCYEGVKAIAEKISSDQANN